MNTDYRFCVVEHAPGSDPSIYRGRPYRQDHSDNWQWYWEGEEMVAVYDDRDYTSPTKGEWTERTEHAIKMHHEYGLSGDRSEDVSSMLTRLARRLLGNWDAKFIPVGLDRGVTLYALSWDGDPEHTWRDEIESVYHGDVWRIEVEEYTPQGWQSDDDVCDEWYGESVAEAAFEKEFPLDAFPAHLVLAEAVGE